MYSRRGKWWLALSLMLALVGSGVVACGPVEPGDGDEYGEGIVDDEMIVDGKADAYGVAEGSPEALGVLKFVNAASFTKLRAANLSKTTANKVLTARTAREGQKFTKVSQLVPYVGKTSFKALVTYAKANGYVEVPTSTFDARLAALRAKYPALVSIATKQGRPAVFLKSAAVADDTTAAKAFQLDVLKAFGPNTLLIWNPAEENYMHAGLGVGDNLAMDAKYRGKGMTVYNHYSLWDMTGGAMDDNCWAEEGQECFDAEQVKKERTVALIKLTNPQLTELNKYFKAIEDDLEGTLGPAEYNGGTPPYISGDPNGKHNCTSWMTEWLAKYVNSNIWAHANPASLMRDLTSGGYSGQIVPEFRALVVYNHPNPPAHGATIPKNFPLEVGH